LDCNKVSMLPGRKEEVLLFFFWSVDGSLKLRDVFFLSSVPIFFRLMTQPKSLPGHSAVQ